MPGSGQTLKCVNISFCRANRLTAWSRVRVFLWLLCVLDPVLSPRPQSQPELEGGSQEVTRCTDESQALLWPPTRLSQKYLGAVP